MVQSIFLFLKCVADYMRLTVSPPTARRWWEGGQAMGPGKGRGREAPTTLCFYLGYTSQLQSVFTEHLDGDVQCWR